MENSNNKQNYILMVITLIVFVLGMGVGVLIGINIDTDKEIVAVNDTSTLQNTSETSKVSQNSEYKTKLSKEERMQTALSNTMSQDEINKLKEKVQDDESDYGNEYKKLTSYNYYKREPDRIYFKSPKVEGFYKFEKYDENYKHIFEVTEDRMFYSVVEDYNLYCFTPDSISRMMTSGDNYIIFDYDNGDLSKYDEDFQQDLIFRFNANTRLFRLATLLSYAKELILVEDLGKSEFATDTTISGYKYMMNANYDNV